MKHPLRRITLAAVAALSLYGCAPQDDGPVEVKNTTESNNTTTETSTSTNTNTNTNTTTNTNITNPATPKGTVSGQVLDVNLQPMSGARVTLTIGSALATAALDTGMDGVFQFRDVPASSRVLVTISRMGYGTIRLDTTVPSSAGDSPVNDANASVGAVVIAPLDGRQAFRVTGPSGNPATGARARLSISRTGYTLLGTVTEDSRLAVEATVDAAGLLTFTGIPRPSTPFLNATYSLAIDPLDANNDGLPESSAFYNSYNANSLLTAGSLPSVRLDFPQAPGSAFSLEASNVLSLINNDRDPLRNMVRLAEPIRLSFNHPVQVSSVEAKLTDEFARDRLDVTTTVSPTGNLVTITPGMNTVRVGQEYNLFVRVVSAQNGAVYSRTATFFVGDLTMPQATTISRIEFIDRASDVSVTRVDGRLDPGERVYVHFNQPILARNAGSFANVEAFFDADLDASGAIGGSALGELGNLTARGFPLYPVEPTGPNYTTMTYVWPQFPVVPSGYTTRFYFDYTGTAPVNPGTVQMGVVRFSLLPFRNVEPYESLWGTPITQDLSGPLSALPVGTVVQ